MTRGAASCLTVGGGAGLWLAGDAAAATDPLAAQGIDHALRSGRACAAAILAGERRRQDGRAAYADYLAQRAAHYALERRWPASPFWRRRAGSPPPVPEGGDRPPPLRRAGAAAGFR